MAPIPAPGPCWQPTLLSSQGSSSLTDISCTYESSAFLLTDPKCLRWDAEEIKSRIIICPPLYSKFNANGTNLTKFYPICPTQSGEDRDFPFIPEKSSTQQSLKFKGQSRCNLTGIYTAEISSLFTASAKIKMPHWTVVGKCTWPTLLWSPEQEHS